MSPPDCLANRSGAARRALRESGEYTTHPARAVSPRHVAFHVPIPPTRHAGASGPRRFQGSPAKPPPRAEADNSCARDRTFPGCRDPSARHRKPTCRCRGGCVASPPPWPPRFGDPRRRPVPCCSPGGTGNSSRESKIRRKVRTTQGVRWPTLRSTSPAAAHRDKPRIAVPAETTAGQAGRES